MRINYRRVTTSCTAVAFLWLLGQLTLFSHEGQVQNWQVWIGEGLLLVAWICVSFWPYEHK